MVRNLRIENINESYVFVYGEESIIKELKSYLTFEVPGAKFSPKYKAKRWDGKVRLLDNNNKVYRGLVSCIQDWANEQKYECEYDEVDEEFSVTEAVEFIKSLKLPIEPRDYQVKAFVKAIRKRRNLLLSPTASGKSLIIYLILRYLHAHNSKRTLIVVPTTSLVMQLTSDFSSYGYDSDSLVHGICEGETKETQKPVIISTWQAIYEQPRKWFDQFEILFGDEAHQFKAKSLTYIATSCINAKHRFGLTGTLDGTITNKLILEGLFGAVYKAATTKELMDAGYVADFEIKALLLKYGASEAKATKSLSYADEMKFLCQHKGRNIFITNLTLSMETNTLVLFQYVESHGDILYQMIRQSSKDPNRKIFYVYGKTETEEREEIRQIVEKESNAIIVASYGTFSTGINIKNLHNVIFASPSKSKIRNLQSIGRSLRTSINKTKAILFDIADDLRYNGKENYTIKHFVERLKLYTEENFKFKIYKIDLKDK